MRVVILFKIWFEMLQKSHFLLQFLWEARKVVLRHNILFFVRSNSFSLIIIKLRASWLSHNFCWVVEEDSSWQIRKKISESVLGWVINPLSDPDLSSLINWSSIVIWSLRSLHLSIMINFYCLTSCCSWRSCLWLHPLDLFWWSRSYRDRRNLLFGLNPSLINLWHLVACFISVKSSLSIVHTSSICKPSNLSRCSWSLTTVHPRSISSQRVSWCWSFESTWKCTCWRVTNTTLSHELTNILAWWRAC